MTLETSHDVMRDMTRIDAILAAFDQQYPSIDSSGIYCLFTGKLIGWTDTCELFDLLDSLPGDPESAADDFAMRLFASMRPSMRWNKMRSDSLTHLSSTAPHETLAYLLNRLASPSSNTSGADFITLHGERIHLFNHVSKFDSKSDDFQHLLMFLLDIESKVGLLSRGNPFMGKDMRVLSLDKILTRIVKLHTTTIAEYEKRNLEALYLQANPNARQAFFGKFNELKPAIPKTPAQAKSSAKLDIFNTIFAGLDSTTFAGSTAAPKNAIATPVLRPLAIPSTLMPRKFVIAHKA